MNTTLIQSYVFLNDKAYFVSTINRECSSPAAYGQMYAETLVWMWNPETKERGPMVWQGEDVFNNIRTHVEVCQRIYATGLPDE
jgi:hypothetical protein